MSTLSDEEKGIYKFTNYREYLTHVLSRYKEQGVSLRALAKKAAFGSPNYLQTIASTKKSITLKTATKIADALGLKGNQRKYFLNLVHLEICDPSEKNSILEDMRRCIKRDLYKDTVEADIFSHWLNGVIMELATTDNFVLTADNICEKLGNLTTRKEVEACLEFLLKRKWLLPTDEQGRFNPAPVKFSVINDIRNIDLQRNHLTFLDIAKHRINDDVSDRDYQGLTISIPMSLMPEVQTRIRDFMQEMRDFLRNREQCDAVIRVQCMAYRVTRK